MRERVASLIGPVAEGMQWLGTFHSIGTKILRRHAELVGLRSDFTILDTDDQLRLMKQVIEAENIDEKRWPARQLASMIDGWKNRGLGPEQVPAGEAGAFANGKGGRLYTRLPGAAEDAERRRFRRPAAGMPAPVARAPRHPGAVPEALPLHAGGRVPGHQRRPVSLAAPARAGAQEPVLRRRRRPVDLWLARRRGRQHPALRARFSRRDGHPAGAQLPLHRPHPFRRLRPHRQEPEPPRQDPAHGGRARREGHDHRRLGFRGRSAPHRRGDRGAARQAAFAGRDRHPRAHLGPDARDRRSARHAGRALSRHRRPALLRARRNPRRPRLSALRQPAGRRPRLRAHRQRAEARPRRRDDPAAAQPCARRPRAADGGGALPRRDRRAEAQAPRHPARSPDLLRPLVEALRDHDAIRGRPDGAGGIRLHRHVAEGQIGRCGRAPRKPQGARALHGGIPRPPELPRARFARDGGQRFRHHRARQPHDAARGEGAGIRHRLPARLGGRPACRTSARSTRAAAPASRKSAGSPMSASPAPGAAPRSTSPRTGASTACGTRPFRAASSTTCRRPNVEVVEAPANFSLGAAMAVARASTACRPSAGSTYQTPGWQRAQAHRAATEDGGYSGPPPRRPARAHADRGRAGGEIHRHASAFSKSAGACSTPSSAPAPSRPSTATSSRSSSTRPGGRWCSTASWRRWASLRSLPSHALRDVEPSRPRSKRSERSRCFRFPTC